jgi:preprotein translocase subunit SecE
MSVKPEVQGGSPLDTVKLTAALILLLGGIVFYYYFASGPHKLITAYRVGGLLIAVAVACLVSLQTRLGRDTWHFLQTSRMEVRKVVWPTRQETVQTTIAVVVMVVLLGVFMWLLDMLLFWLLHGVTGQGG